MSVRVMQWAWEHGPAGSSDAFVLLALADYANDEGECWPSIASIAKRTRMTERGVRKCLARLVNEGWLRAVTGGGRANTNRYIIQLSGAAETLNVIQGIEDANPERGSANPERGSVNPERGSVNPERGSAEPSRTIKNHQEPPTESAARSCASAPPDAIKQAFDAWNAIAAEHGLVQAKALNPKRRQAIKARLTEAGGIDAWQAILSTIPQSPFLMGQTSHAFRMDLDFVLQPTSFVRLMEGKYLDRKASAPLAAEQVEDQRRRRQRLIEQGVIQDDDASAYL